MPQHFLCAQALTLTLTLTVTLTMTTNMDPMTLTRGDDHHDGSKLTLPHFDRLGHGRIAGALASRTMQSPQALLTLV